MEETGKNLKTLHNILHIKKRERSWSQPKKEWELLLQGMGSVTFGPLVSPTEMYIYFNN